MAGRLLPGSGAPGEQVGLQACQPSGTPLVAGSRGSEVRLTMKLRAVAASATVRACGPTVSCVWEIGFTSPWLTSPTVGLITTSVFLFAEHIMLPSVSLTIEYVVQYGVYATSLPQ